MSACRLDAARRQLVRAFVPGGPELPGVHTVTFQPFGLKRNADRLVVERWHILDQSWLFLAVFDGHAGDKTSDYTAKKLPPRLRAKLEKTIQGRLGGQLDRTNTARATKAIEAMLRYEILNFDAVLMNRVRELCKPNVRALTEEDARRLIQEHEEVFERAFQGTTVSLAIVNIDRRLMWAAGVGDSTVALSTLDDTGTRRAERLCELHSFKNPQEYFRVVMARPSAENNIVDRQNRVLGWLAVSRAIGDCALKMSNPYLKNLFRYLPSRAGTPFEGLLSRLRTPPYVSAEPSMRFVDLNAVWGRDPMLLLFTGGVDLLVDNYYTFSPEVHSGVDPMEILPALLAGQDRARVEAVLGHGIEPRWSRADTNMAVDILGNLLGGTNAERLEMVMDERLLRATEGPVFQIDDTTIIVVDLQEV